MFTRMHDALPPFSYIPSDKFPSCHAARTPHAASTNFMELIMSLSTATGAPVDEGLAHVSAVSWGAILAGAAAAASLSLILLLLGTGLGLSSVSPWARDGASAATLGISTILWVTFTQLMASGMGGYLAGRLRTRWVATDVDEVYFRDTAHGFLAWAIASLATAALLTAVIGGIVGGGIQAGASAAGSAASTAAIATANSPVARQDGTADPMGYFLDTLFRKDATTAPVSLGSSGVASMPAGSLEPLPASATTEVGRIFWNTLRTGALPAEDARYVGQLVAQRTGLSQPDAEKRVVDTYARAQTQLRAAETSIREAADTARKASAYTALWLFISLLAGAFFASLAATFGGRQRDM